MLHSGNSLYGCINHFFICILALEAVKSMSSLFTQFKKPLLSRQHSLAMVISTIKEICWFVKQP